MKRVRRYMHTSRGHDEDGEKDADGEASWPNRACAPPHDCVTDNHLRGRTVGTGKHDEGEPLTLVMGVTILPTSRDRNKLVG